MQQLPRRRFLKTLASVSALSPLCLPEIGSAGSMSGRVVLAGGGFAGATCARYLRRIDPSVAVTLVDPQDGYHACPMSNWVIGGLRQSGSLAVNRDGLAAAGVNVV